MSNDDFKVGDRVKVTPRWPRYAASYIEGRVEEVRPDAAFVRYVNGNGAWIEPHRMEKLEKN